MKKSEHLIAYTATQMNAEIHLVKCPKCRKILPEPNIPVYECGGCGAFLQAKKHGNDTRAQKTNSVSSSSSPGGDHDHPSVESSPGSGPRGETMPVDINTLDDQTYSTELNYLKDGKMPPEKNESVVQGEGEGECLSDQAGSKHRSKKPHVRTSGELSESCDRYHENEDSSAEISISEKIYEEGYSLKLNGLTYVKEIEEHHGVLVAEEHNAVDENSRSHLERSLGPKKGKEIAAARGPLTKSIVFAPLSIDDEHLKGFHEGPSLDRISSEEMSDTFPMNPRAPIGSMSRSPTRIYYAGDGSESSYDGTEGESAQVSHLYSRKLKGSGTTSTNRYRQKDGFRIKNKQNGQLKMHNEGLELLGKFRQPNNFSGSEQDWGRLGSPKIIKHSHPVRTSIEAANDEPISRGSYMPRSSQLFLRNGSPANSSHTFLHTGEFRRPDTVLGSDPEKIELLRMVQELEDKINHTHLSKQMLGERSPFRDVVEEMRSGGYYDGLTTGRNPYVDKYSGRQRSHPQGIGYANQPRSSRMAFSGEASLCRNHIDCRCSHCYHQDLHFSPKLSSHCIHCQHEAHPRHDYGSVYHSYTPSPQHYTSSEFANQIPTDNQKKYHERKIPDSREKHQLMKRHLRPLCGGAPIINCHHCSELLQLPADFLLFRRRCHQLRCNSCNRILRFSLLEKSHLVPYVIKIEAPPPRTRSSTSHVNDPQGAGPVSFSDDFEPSFSRNGSTQSGPSVPSSHSLLKNFPNGKQPSNQTFQTMNDRKMKTFMEIYQATNNNSRFNIEAAGTSSSTSTRLKPSSEIEELPATSSSPLHQLMGYESPGQLLFAKSEDESEDGMGYYMDQHIL